MPGRQSLTDPLDTATTAFLTYRQQPQNRRVIRHRDLAHFGVVEAVSVVGCDEVKRNFLSGSSALPRLTDGPSLTDRHTAILASGGFPRPGFRPGRTDRLWRRSGRRGDRITDLEFKSHVAAFHATVPAPAVAEVASGKALGSVLSACVRREGLVVLRAVCADCGLAAGHRQRRWSTYQAGGLHTAGAQPQGHQST